MKYTKEDAQSARKLLEKICPPETTVYTVLRSVSRSGMQRLLTLHIIVENEPLNLTYAAAKVLGRCIRENAIVERGVGMDMGFHLVNSLQYALYGINSDKRLHHRWL